MKEHDFETIVPPTIAKDPALKEKFDGLCGKIQALYNEMTEAGIPAEDARYILPNATETKIVVTMNARSLLALFRAALLQSCPMGNPGFGEHDA